MTTNLDPNPWEYCDANGIPFDLAEAVFDAYDLWRTDCPACSDSSTYCDDCSELHEVWEALEPLDGSDPDVIAVIPSGLLLTVPAVEELDDDDD
jgi:hypothetical protein